MQSSHSVGLGLSGRAANTLSLISVEFRSLRSQYTLHQFGTISRRTLHSSPGFGPTRLALITPRIMDIRVDNMASMKFNAWNSKETTVALDV